MLQARPQSYVVARWTCYSRPVSQSVCSLLCCVCRVVSEFSQIAAYIFVPQLCRRSMVGLLARCYLMPSLVVVLRSWSYGPYTLNPKQWTLRGSKRPRKPPPFLPSGNSWSKHTAHPKTPSPETPKSQLKCPKLQKPNPVAGLKPKA